MSDVGAPSRANTSDRAPAGTGLRWYLLSACSFIVPGGIQQVLFPWLVAFVLMESADRVGLAQMASALPALALILFGGVLGDRLDQRRILIVVHILASLPPLVMAWVIYQGSLSYASLIVYALVAGAFGAFSQPARDALLTQVAGGEIQRTVTLMLMLTFGVQIIGFSFAGFADTIGPVALMVMQAGLMAAGVFAVLRIPRPAARVASAGGNPLADIFDGVLFVIRSASVGPTVLVTFAMGVFFAGVYIVLLPLMVRDLYGGSSFEISLAFACFMLGTVVTTVLLVRLGGVQRWGRALVFGLVSGSLVLVPLAFAPPLWLFYASVFLWGMSAGVTMAMSRTIVQEAATESHRARIMSVYSLSMMGGMPIGSLLMGYVIEFVGPAQATWLPVVGVLAMVGAVAARTRLWYIAPASVQVAQS